METQKERWAARADRYEAMACRANEQAAALETRREHETDIAFLTQPGRIPARDRMHRRLERAGELRAKAERYSQKASNLRALATRNKGDAERARDAIRAVPIEVGALTTSMYGVRRITKVNTKTVRLEGISAAVDRSFVRQIAAAA